MYVAIRIVISYINLHVRMHYPLLSSLDVPVDMVHPVQPNYQWCAGLALYL